MTGAVVDKQTSGSNARGFPQDVKKQLARRKVEARLALWHKTDEEESMAKVTRRHASEFMDGSVPSFACAWQAAAEESFAKIMLRNSSATAEAAAAAVASSVPERRASSSPERCVQPQAMRPAPSAAHRPAPQAHQKSFRSLDLSRDTSLGNQHAHELDIDLSRDTSENDGSQGAEGSAASSCCGSTSVPDPSRVPEIERDIWVPRQLVRPRQKLPMWGRAPQESASAPPEDSESDYGSDTADSTSESEAEACGTRCDSDDSEG